MILLRIVAGFIAWTILGHAVAQQAQDATYPVNPIRLVVTFPPGGSADITARTLGAKMSERLGQPIIIDNRPGAGGNIGLDIVAKASPDGYTIGLGAAGALAVNVSLYPKMPFDPVKDFAPVGMVAIIPFVFVANPSIPAANLRDLLALAKAKPRSLAIGHGGNGTAMHLSAELLKQMSGIDVDLVPYKGSGPATTDAMSNQIPLAISDIPASIAFITSGKLKALGVTSTKRSVTLPDVPSFAEAGVPGYESIGWFGMVAPAGTPIPVLNRLNAELQSALNDPETNRRILATGAEPMSNSPSEFRKMIESEIQKWAKVIKVSGARIE
ncbi:MAG: tripartite tricarboxylate transporter substrate binding protein [Proteobacteria bacterium]|nr:tripartite tricarboxylate transporter substrate binding protein [Pseudomonadota bacterium]